MEWEGESSNSLRLTCIPLEESLSLYQLIVPWPIQKVCLARKTKPNFGMVGEGNTSSHFQLTLRWGLEAMKGPM